MGTRNAKTGGKEKAKKGHPRARENIMMYTSMAGFLSFFSPSSFMGIQQQCHTIITLWILLSMMLFRLSGQGAGTVLLTGSFLRLGNDQQWRVIPCFFLLLLLLRLSFFANDDGLAGIFAKRSPDISKTRPTSPGPSRCKDCDVDVLDAAKVHLCLLVCYPSAPLLSSHPPFSLCQGQSRASETQKRGTTRGKRKQAERSAVEALAGATVKSV
ncbi:hypothetical protein TRV_02799 [Trichophyton verrucosum HKI 0517]|uniref:Transmembrane protein n=1 Tax=Trichophyton verrucosum (strain HKI 0517) TaxID=663202 RepID=D4D6S2_TRIVH|nr:uncharacterized protein TRV_02799 [Trichophyton verrucosum HKI 0517]EFE42434.1 hypothetical protein TRV_02799 [Trichophyton verrucosum HKI 0517]